MTNHERWSEMLLAAEESLGQAKETLSRLYVELSNAEAEQADAVGDALEGLNHYDRVFGRLREDWADRDDWA